MKSNLNQNPDFSEEELFWGRGVFNVAGVDEVGRGCIAGPVVAAAVVLNSKSLADFSKLNDLFLAAGIRDSKKLSPKKRENLSVFIKENSIAWAIQSIDSKTVDKINILQASFLAMAGALDQLRVKLNLNLQDMDTILDSRLSALIDGSMTIPEKYISGIEQKALIRGDNFSISIAASSILAKVHRDAYMVELSKKYPDYGFESHKGYGSKFHLTALGELGLTTEHRLSYAPVQKIAQRNQNHPS